MRALRCGGVATGLSRRKEIVIIRFVLCEKKRYGQSQFFHTIFLYY